MRKTEKVSDTKLLCLLLSGNKQSDIAQELGLTVSQVNRRIKDDDFQELLKMYRAKVVEATSVVLASQAQKAAQVLVDLLDNSNPYIRYSASTSVLKICREYQLQMDVLEDLQQLKEAYLNDV